MINDEEDLLKSLRLHIKENLNNKIDAINTEKDDFKLESITKDDVHYVFAADLLDIPNNTFVQIAIDSEIEVKHNGGDLISIPPIIIEVVFDNPKDRNTFWKSMRYMRALHETISEYDDISIDRMQITKLTPMFVASTRRELVVSGVGISCAIST